MTTARKHFKADGAARARDWSIAVWAIGDTVRKTGAGGATLLIVMGAMLTMMIYAIVTVLWPQILAVAIAVVAIKLALRWYRWHREAYAAVPWDDDYRDPPGSAQDRDGIGF